MSLGISGGGDVFGRRVKRTYSQIMMDELNEGFDHLWLAGAAAAAGLGSTVGPRWAQTRVVAGPPVSRFRDAASLSWESTVSAIAPLVGVARSEARRAATRDLAGRAVARGVAGRMTGQLRKEKAMKKGKSMSRKGWMVTTGLVTLGAGAGIAGALMMRRRRRAQWEEFDARAAVDMTQGDAILVDSPGAPMTGKGGAGEGSAAKAAKSSTPPGNASGRHDDERPASASTMDMGRANQPSKNSRLS